MCTQSEIKYRMQDSSAKNTRNGALYDRGQRWRFKFWNEAMTPDPKITNRDTLPRIVEKNCVLLPVMLPCKAEVIERLWWNGQWSESESLNHSQCSPNQV